MTRTINQIAESGYATAYEIEEFCLTKEVCLVVRFHDTLTDVAWFKRDVEEIGHLEAWMYSGEPLNKAELLATAKRQFGDCAVLLPF